MRSSRMALSVVLTLAFALAAAAQQFEKVPQGQSAPPPAAPPAAAAMGKIATLNVEAAMARTQEGRKALEDMQAYLQPRAAELEKLLRDGRDLESQLQAQARTLSDEARLQLQREIEAKRKQYSRLEQDLRDEREEMAGEHQRRIGFKMEKILTAYAAERGISIVIGFQPGGVVLFHAASVDITDDIVRLYDQTYPLPAAAPAPASGTRPPAAQQPRPAPQQQAPPPKPQPKQ